MCPVGVGIGVDLDPAFCSVFRPVEQRHELGARGFQIASPDDVKVAICNLPGILAACFSSYGTVSGSFGRAAEGADLAGGAHTIEKGISAASLYITHHAGVAAGKDSFRPALCDDLLPGVCDAADGFFPGYRCKFTASFFAGPDQRRQDTVPGIDTLLIMCRFPADSALGYRVIRVISDADNPAIFDLDQKTAGIGAVVRTNRLFDFRHGKPSLQMILEKV